MKEEHERKFIRISSNRWVRLADISFVKKEGLFVNLYHTGMDEMLICEFSNKEDLKKFIKEVVGPDFGAAFTTAKGENKVTQ